MSDRYAIATGYAKGSLQAIAIKASAAADHLTSPADLKARLRQIAAECDQNRADLELITAGTPLVELRHCDQCQHAISAHNEFGCKVLNAPGQPWAVCLCIRSQRELLCAAGQHDASYDDSGCCDRCGTWAGARTDALPPHSLNDSNGQCVTDCAHRIATRDAELGTARRAGRHG